MEFNFLAVLVAALSSFVVGFIWYNPKVFGTIWMKEAGLTQEQLKKGNMLKIFSLTFIYSLMLAFIMQALVIHQMGAIGMVGGSTLVETAKPSYLAFMADYGDAFRTFKHGALHGFISGIFLATPIIAINGLFEHKTWKNIAIHAGYWIVVMTIMGSIICGWK
jgi:nitrate reductase gamma subunit